ncbi:hypothetical protein D9757_007983 [Collybiopsis confluens]|uniref:Fungal-type protein kinase domain-containing protein n=1 Tax=Collybiopsis confluens TaxID=2823264 RepID=A0A8H5H6A1_9AGAR|nr:hypothetical protein D9757_007983 [Collybiopsis confluens]
MSQSSHLPGAFSPPSPSSPSPPPSSPQSPSSPPTFSPPSLPPPAGTPPNKTIALPHSTPINRRAVTLHAATSNHYVFKEPHARAANEMENKYEKIPIEDFLNLLPEAPARPVMPNPNYSALARVAQLKEEMCQYNPFIKAMKPYLAKNWHLVNTSNSPDTSPAVEFFSGTAIKPDLGLYAESRPKKRLTDASCVELFGEFKIKKVDDPFYVQKIDSEEPASARDTRGQIALYMNSVQAAQQRTRVFLFFILKDKCRLFCHSRAGTQYTDLFKHTEEPHLHSFFWRLTHSKRADRGHDTTMEPVVGSEPGADEARAAFNIDDEATLYRVQVGKQIFFVDIPFTLFTFTPSVEELDCWRNAKYAVEHRTYRKLKSAGVCNVPCAIAGGDVKGPLQSVKFRTSKLRLIHYRLVLDFVGAPLADSGSTYGFSKVIFDAFKAHRDACEKANLLHRDVSAGNIIIWGGRGYLIDWERAKNLDDVGARAKHRTGTWQFMSIRLLENSKIHQEIRDDLESFVYVIVHTAIHFAKNAMTPGNRLFLLKIFEQDEKEASYGRLLLVAGGSLRLLLSTGPFEALIYDLVKIVSYAYATDADLMRDVAMLHGPINQLSPEALQQITDNLRSQLLTHDSMYECFERATSDTVWENWPEPDWEPNEIAEPCSPRHAMYRKFKKDLEYRGLVSSIRSIDHGPLFSKDNNIVGDKDSDDEDSDDSTDDADDAGDNNAGKVTGKVVDDTDDDDSDSTDGVSSGDDDNDANEGDTGNEDEDDANEDSGGS